MPRLETRIPVLPQSGTGERATYQVPKGWAPEGIAACVPESAKRWRGKRGGIEPLRCALVGKPGIPHFIQMFVSSPPCLPGICLIATDDGSKSNTRVGVEQVVNLPVPQDVVEHTVSSGKSPSLPNRNFVKRVHG